MLVPGRRKQQKLRRMKRNSWFNNNIRQSKYFLMLNRLLQFWFEPFIFWTRLQLSFVLSLWICGLHGYVDLHSVMVLVPSLEWIHFGYLLSYIKHYGPIVFFAESMDLFLVFYIVVTRQYLELFGRKEWAELWRLIILVLSMPNWVFYQEYSVVSVVEIVPTDVNATIYELGLSENFFRVKYFMFPSHPSCLTVKCDIFLSQKVDGMLIHEFVLLVLLSATQHSWIQRMSTLTELSELLR